MILLSYFLLSQIVNVYAIFLLVVMNNSDIKDFYNILLTIYHARHGLMPNSKSSQWFRGAKKKFLCAS